MLVEKAMDYEKTSYRGLFNFVRYIEQLQAYQVDYGEVNLTGAGNTAVEIMTIHKSKGLEFPVVFVAGMGKQFNFQDMNAGLLLHPELGIGADAIIPEKRVIASSLNKQVIRRQLLKESLGEELRVLYVAMTRAKEKLILTGTVGKLEKQMLSLSRFLDEEEELLPLGTRMKAKNYWAFVLPALVRHRAMSELLWEYGILMKKQPGIYDDISEFVIKKITVRQMTEKAVLIQAGNQMQEEYLKNWDENKVYDEAVKEEIEKRFSLHIRINIWKIFRYNAFTLSQKNMWNYGGTPFSNNASLRWQSMTMNRYEWDVKETFAWNWLDSRLLRGGPDVRFGSYFLTSAKFNTDKAKRMMFMLKYEGDHNFEGNRFNTISPSLTFRLGNHVYLSGQLDYAWNTDEMQYVATTSPLSSSSLAPYYYVMGHMDQKTYGLTLKLQVNVTPDISIQFYGAPFTSIAKYDDFKLAADTKSHTFENRFQRIDPDQLTYADGVYTIGEGAGQMPFRNPDFRFNEFRSNLVARWEYLPGSTLYFVWEHRMSNRDNWYSSGWGSNLDRMWGLPATNTFMIKMNYWFNL